jgi:hypothetical protein
MKVASIRTADSRHDPELVWLLVLGAIGIAGLAAFLLRVPTPGCLFHDLTGLPCVTCGGTRCLHSLIAGDFGNAFLWNPMIFLMALGCVVFMLYALAVVCFRLPRLRLVEMSSGQTWAIRGAIVALLAANWVYVISRGV